MQLGGVAHMVERSLRMREARGSIPRTSIFFPLLVVISSKRPQNAKWLKRRDKGLNDINFFITTEKVNEFLSQGIKSSKTRYQNNIRQIPFKRQKVVFTAADTFQTTASFKTARNTRAVVTLKTACWCTIEKNERISPNLKMNDKQIKPQTTWKQKCSEKINNKA